MRVLFVTSELYPLAKTGGLADVCAGLPVALRRQGVDATVVLPGHEAALDRAAGLRTITSLDGIAGETVRVLAARTPDTGLPIYLLDCPALFRRPDGLYQDRAGRDWPDNAHRFAVFSRAAVRLALGGLGEAPDIVHCHDWHAALVPALLANRAGRRPATVFTIHNLAFQGLFPPEVLAGTGLAPAHFHADGVEFYGQVSYLKAGIRFADRLTTVSPTYAREILTPAQGCGLEGFLATRRAHLSGILNGADYDVWSPETGRTLPAAYGPRDLAGKRVCKRMLQTELGLAVDPDRPIVALLSRLTHQKMADLLPEILPAIAARGLQVVVHGQGDPGYEDAIARAVAALPGVAVFRRGYDEDLAQRVLAGADMLLMPSRYEPCGLSQLYAMRFGTAPIVRRVGGLADTVIGHGPATIDVSTGFVFDGDGVIDVVEAVDQARRLYAEPLAWRKLQRRTMAADFGWARSAAAYVALYAEATGTSELPAADRARRTTRRPARIAKDAVA